MDSRAWLNRNVLGMTATSFCSDACYEMIISVLPGFMAAVGISPAALGWIEGSADALSSFLKLWSGWYSDRVGRRKPTVVIGYFFTGTGMSLFAFAKTWPLLLLGRMISWFGKGIRGSLRDAMLAESVPEPVRGRAFGFHRAGDTLGAILGPLAGVLLLHFLPPTPPDHPFRVIFLVSLIPGIAAPLAFAFLVRETLRRPNPQRLWTAVRELPSPFRRFLAASGLFGLGDYSPTLLVMAAAVLLTPAVAASLYLLRNVVEAVAAYPIGALGDRASRTRLLAAGYLLSALVAIATALLFTSGTAHPLIPFILIFTAAGIVAACQDTLAAAIPAAMVTERTRGTAYGSLGFVNGFGDLAASALTGTLWTVASPTTAFLTAGAIMLLGALLMSTKVTVPRA